MQVFIKITVSSNTVGPTFSIVPNVGTSSVLFATLADITTGIYVTLSDPSATFITITSLGTCVDSEILFLGTTTTTTSSSTSTTTSTTICINTCYKVTNISNTTQNFQSLDCQSGLIPEQVSPIGTSGSIQYICSGIPINSNSNLIVEEIPDYTPEFNNCPCSSQIIIVPGNICTSPLSLLFDQVTKVIKLNNPSDELFNSTNGPGILSSLLSLSGISFNLCNNSLPPLLSSSLCDFSCQPLFLGGRSARNLLVNSLSFGPECYNPTLNNCCWISAQSSTNSADYCQSTAIEIVNISTTTTTTCYSCETGCNTAYNAKIVSNCTENCFNPPPITDELKLEFGPFGDAVGLFKNKLTPSQYQDILNLQIIESGDYGICRSLLSDLNEIVDSMSATLAHSYLSLMLTRGLVIYRSGFGSCNITFQWVDSYLSSIEVPCATTTSTTSTTSTSTTTTTTCLCNAWNITIEQDDIDNSTFIEDEETIPGFVGINYLSCSGNIAESGFEIAGIYNEAICSCCTPSLFYFDGTKFVEATSTATITAIDCRSTTTTTTLPCNCVEITGVGDDCEPTSEGTYDDCDGNSQSYYLPINTSIIACMRLGTLNETSGKVEVEEEYGDRILADFGIDQFYATCQCIGTTTTTTSTSSTTTTTTCNCFVTNVLAINTDCDPCESCDDCNNSSQKLLASIKYTDCQGNEIVEQVPSGILSPLLFCVLDNSVTAVQGTELREVNKVTSCCS